MMEAVNQVMQAKQVALALQIQTAVASKVLDSQEATGDAVNKMLEAAMRLSKAAGSGQQFDAVG